MFAMVSAAVVKKHDVLRKTRTDQIFSCVRRKDVLLRLKMFKFKRPEVLQVN